MLAVNDDETVNDSYSITDSFVIFTAKAHLQDQNSFELFKLTLNRFLDLGISKFPLKHRYHPPSQSEKRQNSQS